MFFKYNFLKKLRRNHSKLSFTNSRNMSGFSTRRRKQKKTPTYTKNQSLTIKKISDKCGRVTKQVTLFYLLLDVILLEKLEKNSSLWKYFHRMLCAIFLLRSNWEKLCAYNAGRCEDGIVLLGHLLLNLEVWVCKLNSKIFN